MPAISRARRGAVIASDASVALALESGESRVQQMVALIDQCTAAKKTADALGEKFLAYLLAMTIQESRAAIRRNDVASQ